MACVSICLRSPRGAAHAFLFRKPISTVATRAPRIFAGLRCFSWSHSHVSAPLRVCLLRDSVTTAFLQCDEFGPSVFSCFARVHSRSFALAFPAAHRFPFSLAMACVARTIDLIVLCCRWAAWFCFLMLLWLQPCKCRDDKSRDASNLLQMFAGGAGAENTFLVGMIVGALDMSLALLPFFDSDSFHTANLPQQLSTYVAKLDSAF